MRQSDNRPGGNAVPTVNEFKNGIYISGSYNGTAANAPILRAQSGAPMNMNNPPPAGSHLSLSFTPPAAPPAPRATTSSATTPICAEGAYSADASTGGQKVPFVAGGGHGVIYLPFVQTMICSAIVPGGAGSGVDRFYTDNLSGCSIFIDRVTGTQDFVVYHGNRTDLTTVPNAPQYLAATPFASQYLPARNMMRINHTSAQADLLAQMAPGSGLTPVARCERATYFLPVENELNRKRAQGRARVDIAAAGTNVMGFRVAGASWEFWWQTWALLTYDRPRAHIKSLVGHRHHAMNLGHARLLGSGRFAVL